MKCVTLGSGGVGWEIGNCECVVGGAWLARWQWVCLSRWCGQGKVDAAENTYFLMRSGLAGQRFGSWNVWRVCVEGDVGDGGCHPELVMLVPSLGFQPTFVPKNSGGLGLYLKYQNQIGRYKFEFAWLYYAVLAPPQTTKIFMMSYLTVGRHTFSCFGYTKLMKWQFPESGFLF